MGNRNRPMFGPPGGEITVETPDGVAKTFGGRDSGVVLDTARNSLVINGGPAGYGYGPFSGGTPGGSYGAFPFDGDETPGVQPVTSGSKAPFRVR